LSLFPTDPATTALYTLSLHDALPIFAVAGQHAEQVPHRLDAAAHRALRDVLLDLVLEELEGQGFEQRHRRHLTRTPSRAAQYFLTSGPRGSPPPGGRPRPPAPRRSPAAAGSARCRPRPWS